MIVCCGEALIDMIPARVEGHDEEGFVPHPGGAVFNTAISLGRLGVPSAMLTALSNDVFGQTLRVALNASHVDTSYSVATDRPSTLAFVHLTNGHATYTFFDENSALRNFVSSEVPEIDGEISALFFGGVSLVNLPGAETFERLMEKQSPNYVTMLDPNIRPNFITDTDLYRKRLENMITYADIVKISDEDLDWIVPGVISLEDKLQAIKNRGVPVVVLTRGADGATAYLKDGQAVTILAQKAEVVDTVGAGDTFNAGILADLSNQGLLTKEGIRNLSVEQARSALEYGAKIAAITVSRAGANPPWLDEL